MSIVTNHSELRTKGVGKPVEGWAADRPRGDTGSLKGAVILSRDPGALSGPLAGAGFVAGVAGALSLADAPYPRPSSEPADVRRYFGGTPARSGSA